jgi:K+-sensing histidine kinase KdpD
MNDTEWRSLALGIAALLAQQPDPHDELLAVLARHLKAPVAALRAHAERLELQAAGQSPANVARRIVEQADLMAEWVAAILDVQRIRLGKLQLDIQPVDLVELAYACADRVRQSTAELDINFEARGPSAEPVRGDPVRLSHVLVLLMQKAAQSAASGEIELCVGRHTWRDGQQRALLSVCEAGQTLLEPERFTRMIDAQTTTPDLDVYVARELTRLHGGELWAAHAADGRHGGALVVLPLDFSHRSHAVLARGRSCSPTL